jgi:phosphotransferase family enzyme
LLTETDADVVGRDPALPGLGVVLDPDRVAEILRPALPKREIGAGRLGWIRYRPHDFCRAAYRFEVPGGEIDIGLHACIPADLAAWRENGGDRIVLDDLALIVTVFPNDPMLVGLAPLETASGRPDVLRELLPDRPDLWHGELRRLRYRPERRFTAELRSRESRVLVKSYTRRGFKKSQINAGAFRTRGPLRVARLLGASKPHQLLAFEWLPGRMLRDLCGKPEGDGGSVALAAAALAELHAQNPEGLVPWTRSAEIADLAVIRSEVAFLAPGLTHRAATVSERLAKRLADTVPRYGAMHGDFTGFQVLVDDGVAGIIDLDLACCGDVTDDLGNFLAQVERMGLHGALTPSQVAAIGSDLLDGYKHAAGALPGDVRLYTALQLFRRSRFPFRAREPQWPRRMEELIDRAEAILDDRG